MASILRQIVAGPRAKHPEAGLDLCYVTDKIVATSGPSATWPELAYRNPLKDLRQFLDLKHGDQWAIWEFRAEGTGYPDSEVYGRVRHYPWPDHHPPPFALIPLIMASMRNWLNDKDAEGRVVVVHCKAGKGRSGTVACSYLISEEGWTPDDAMQRFTERRMRPGFGVGISIPSQRRWITYVDRWARHGKLYVERPVEILEVQVWGLRDGVKIMVEGYVEEGKVIKKFHTFHSLEREIVRGSINKETGIADVTMEAMGRKKAVRDKRSSTGARTPEIEKALDAAQKDADARADESTAAGGDVIFRPSSRVVLPSSDINIDFERRNKTTLGGFTMVTSVAHVWFNTFFEGKGPENSGTPDDSGVFEINWDAMDGIKGSSRKGTCAFDKMAVVWKAVDLDRKPSVVINEPPEGEEVVQAEPADWRGESRPVKAFQKTLGLRPKDSDSASVSCASSMRSQPNVDVNDSAEELKGVKSDAAGVVADPILAEQIDGASPRPESESTTARAHIRSEPLPQIHIDGVPSLEDGSKHVSTSDLPDGKPETDLKDHHDRAVGEMAKFKKEDHIS
ncbi:Telomerase protein component 1 [Vermiconidia calcicola]|uniref:Telomerase protein component 1 n=1 Tax=Vermiconidia calcicola TaxID=1690605 RepID=A0ACC3MM23_9PEZI|nr:Telomerase protein component 1 [Vermiconidia calcicola]